MRYGKQKGEKISGGRANRNCDHEKEEKISELRYGKQNVKKISELSEVWETECEKDQ